jgi:predicted TPR repeat methyltransferase
MGNINNKFEMSARLDDSEGRQDSDSATMSLHDALVLATRSQREGRLPEAVNIYHQILAVVPECVDALHFLGVAEDQVGHPEAALQLINRAIALAPDHSDALSNRGNVYRSLRRFDEAEADYRRALALRPDDPNTLSNLGTILHARGDLEGAVATFRQVIARNPDHSAAWQNLGSTLENLQRGAEALDALREAVRLAPESAEMYLDLGKALYAVGHLTEAVDMYRRCLTLSPGHARARHLLAACTGEDAPARASDGYVRAEFDAFAPTFDAALARLEYCGPALVAQAVEEIAANSPPDLIVLDAGCGTGLCGPLLRSRARVLVGVDLCASMVALARKRGVYDELVVEELTTYLCQHARTIDLIVSADTLVYFGDLVEVTAAAAEALRPEGALIFTVERAEPGDAQTGYRLSPHGRYSHTREYVAKVLGEAGFAAVAIRDTSTRKERGQWAPGLLVRACIRA